MAEAGRGRATYPVCMLCTKKHKTEASL